MTFLTRMTYLFFYVIVSKPLTNVFLLLARLLERFTRGAD